MLWTPRFRGGDAHERALFALSGSLPAELFASADTGPFGAAAARIGGARIPVTVVTGFLGSGKTTLIRELLSRPEGANTAVVINEYGEVGIDNALLRASSDANGAARQRLLCCTVRTDLQESLRTLFADRARGAVPSFQRVIIEPAARRSRPGACRLSRATVRWARNSTCNRW